MRKYSSVRRDEPPPHTKIPAGPSIAPDDSESDNNGASEQPRPLPPLTVDEWRSRDLPAPDYLQGIWLTTTSRALLIAPTGLGKTNFRMQGAYNASLGEDFLHWKGHRPCRVLCVDGEMSRRLLRDRVLDCERRAGQTSKTFFALSHEDVLDRGYGPLNTPQGQQYLDRLIKEIGGVDLVEFDSIMCLTNGEMKDEDPWSKVVPWTRSLTARNIGQVWVHHTGHDTSKGYARRRTSGRWTRSSSWNP